MYVVSSFYTFVSKDSQRQCPYGYFMLKISDNLLYLQIAVYSKNKFTIFLQYPVKKCFDIMYNLSFSPSLLSSSLSFHLLVKS